jgi:hypothetical protein
MQFTDQGNWRCSKMIVTTSLSPQSNIGRKSPKSPAFGARDELQGVLMATTVALGTLVREQPAYFPLHRSDVCTSREWDCFCSGYGRQGTATACTCL